MLGASCLPGANSTFELEQTCTGDVLSTDFLKEVFMANPTEASCIPASELSGVTTNCDNSEDEPADSTTKALKFPDPSFEVSPCACFFPQRLPTRAETTIIIDWDDTLLPTSFVGDAIRICAPKYAAPGHFAGSNRNARGMPRGTAGCSLPKDFPCFAALQRHARLVEEVLRSARALASRVAILTLADRPWVFESAEQYLPGLHIKELLQELQIPVYYASEYRHASSPRVLGDCNHPDVSAKFNAMAEFLQIKTGCVLPGDEFLNFISIGDSFIEQEAARGVQAYFGNSNQRALCKTVKLLEDPSLKCLTEELQELLKQFGSLISYAGDVDVHAQGAEDLQRQLAALDQQGLTK